MKRRGHKLLWQQMEDCKTCRNFLYSHFKWESKYLPQAQHFRCLPVASGFSGHLGYTSPHCSTQPSLITTCDWPYAPLHYSPPRSTSVSDRNDRSTFPKSQPCQNHFYIFLGRVELRFKQDASFIAFSRTTYP